MDASTSSIPPMIKPDKVTVAIEGWNADSLGDRRHAERSAASCRSQDYPIGQRQLLVLAAAPVADETRRFYQSQLPGFEIVPVEAATYYRMKNAALKHAEGDYLVVADSDVVYTPGWLGAMLGSLAPEIDVVVGHTWYADGFLSRSQSICDWGATRPVSGPTDWIYGNNLALRLAAFPGLHFREDLGRTGGGATDIVRATWLAQGTRLWFCRTARASHNLEPFLTKRLRMGAFHVHHRQRAPHLPGARLMRVPLLGPALVTAGTMVRAWVRSWQLRRDLPLGVAVLPAYLLSIAFVKAVEAVGATIYALNPGWIERRFHWFDVLPPSLEAGAGRAA